MSRRPSIFQSKFFIDIRVYPPRSLSQCMKLIPGCLTQAASVSYSEWWLMKVFFGWTFIGTRGKLLARDDTIDSSLRRIQTPTAAQLVEHLAPRNSQGPSILARVFPRSPPWTSAILAMIVSSIRESSFSLTCRAQPHLNRTEPFNLFQTFVNHDRPGASSNSLIKSS